MPWRRDSPPSGARLPQPALESSVKEGSGGERGMANKGLVSHKKQSKAIATGDFNPSGLVFTSSLEKNRGKHLRFMKPLGFSRISVFVRRKGTPGGNITSQLATRVASWKTRPRSLTETNVQ